MPTQLAGNHVGYAAIHAYGACMENSNKPVARVMHRSPSLPPHDRERQRIEHGID
jgi:hypothetical protein